MSTLLGAGRLGRFSFRQPMESPDLESWSVPPERRWAKRFPVTWPIKVRGLNSAGQSFEESGELGNLSSAGALVRLDQKLQVGAETEVLILVPLRTETWMKYPATVMRVENGAGRAGLGIKFSTCRPQFLIE